MKRVLVLLGALSSGCGVLYLDPKGESSLCAATHPEMQSAVNDAVDYWVQAGLANLHPCSKGSVEVEVVDTLPGESGSTHEDNDGTIHVYVNHGVWAAAQSADPPARVYASTVLAHELGHALGMPHSPDKRSVMFWNSVWMENPVYDGDATWAEGLWNGITLTGPGKL